MMSEMASPSAPRWQDVESRLRPFVRSRVGADADADDVLQEVLMRMHRGLGGLKDSQKLDAWMYAIARTAIVDHQRSRARHPLAPRGDTFEAEVDPFEEEADEAMQSLVRVVGLFVSMLPSPYREALTLTELEGRSQKEAAEMLGITVPALKSRLHRGRKRLRDALDACCRIAVDARGKVIECEPRADASMDAECCG
jgi:RNA polymerase sigma-70 factor (ECF subfamily)